jgi:FMN phosphatase YigB (HAD superfamily)
MTTTDSVSRPPLALAAVLFDFGDTIADERSERKQGGVTQTACLAPHAAETLKQLAQWCPLGLVADGRQDSYTNVLGQHGLQSVFGAVVSSDLAGAEKPSPKPFELCLDLLGIARSRWAEVVMVGNRVDRDVAGAKRLGMRTVLITWSDRYRVEPETSEERPDFLIEGMDELLPTLAKWT